MDEEQQKDPLLSRIPNWLKTLLISTGVVGGGSAGIITTAEDIITERLAPSMAIVLEKEYGLTPLPKNVIPILQNADSLLSQYDEVLYTIGTKLDTVSYLLAYQSGVNHVLIQMYCDTVLINGLQFYKDCYGNLWTEQKYNGLNYIFMASKQYDKWVYFPLPWMVGDVGQNIKPIL